MTPKTFHANKCKCGSTWIIVCERCHEYAPANLWISIKEQMPEKGTEILTFGKLGICTAQIAWFNDDGTPYFMCKEDFRVEPTHWMRLPKPPENNGMD